MTAGTGSVQGSLNFSGRTMTVNLTGRTNAQQIGVTLSKVTDAVGQVLPNASALMKVLLGDTNGSSGVNASDVGRTKAASGQAVSSANFRQDVNKGGAINASDIGLVKFRSGASVP